MVKISECKTDIEFKGDASAKGYKTFNSSGQSIGLFRIGQSAIFAVPAKQRGALARYAGRFVHIVCVGRTDNFSGRTFAVAEVTEQGDLAPRPHLVSAQSIRKSPQVKKATLTLVG